MITFSNPRHEATFTDWPLGGSKRGTCTFKVEKHPKRGYRVGRTTTGKTKYDTYSPRVAIVDGSNGRTYILSDTVHGFVSIAKSDFMSPSQDELGFDHAVFERDAERYAELKALLAAVPE